MVHTNFISIVMILTFFIFCISGCDDSNSLVEKMAKIKTDDSNNVPETMPQIKLKVLFVHHSCGGQWLADKGKEKEHISNSRIYLSHPNGGGLRRLMEENNYEVHEASYGSIIGEKTAVCDWNRKFKDRMEDILRCEQQDKLYSDGSTNDIIMFKSCYPINWIESDGKEPGDPDSSIRTIANYKAAYSNLLQYFEKYPDKLFVIVTAPPLAKNIPSRTKELIKNFLEIDNSVRAVGNRARKFNNWLKDSKTGWLSGYKKKNVAVFDYYDVLTGHGKSNYSMYPTRGGVDSHPSSVGNSIASHEFVSFLNRAVNRFLKSKHSSYQGD